MLGSRPRATTPDAKIVRLAVPVSLVLMACLIVLGPMLLGGIPPWAATSLGVVACVMAGMLAFSTPGWHSRLSSRVAWLLFAGLGCTALQATPLPSFLTGWLAPQSLLAARETAELVGAPEPYFVALTQSPGATAYALTTACLICCGYLAGATLTTHGYRSLIWKMVAIAGAVMAVIGLLHAAAGLRELFGVYRPKFGNVQLLTPLINTNNLAGFLGLTTMVSLGLGLDKNRESRGIWLVCATLTGATCMMTLSRGGIAALLAGVVLFITLLTSRRRRDRRVTIVAAGAATAGTLGLSAYIAGPRIASELSRTDFGKLELLRESASFALNAPPLGIGRGAFSTAFVSHHGSLFRFEYPENLVTQWLSEWGLLFGTLWLAGLGAALWAIGKKIQSSSSIGAFVGVLVIATHNLVDFSLELPAIALLVSVMLGTLVAPRGRRGNLGKDPNRFQSFPPTSLSSIAAPNRGPMIIAGASALVIAITTPTVAASSVSQSNHSLMTHVRSGNRTAFRSTLTRAVSLHPSEPSMLLIAGVEAAQHGDAQALRWLSRAMTLAPGWPGPHLEAADFLATHGRTDQAMLEMREAAMRGPEQSAKRLCALHERLGQDQITPARALASIPRRSPATFSASRSSEIRKPHGAKNATAEYLLALGACLPLESAAAAAVDDATLRRHSSALPPRIRIVRRLLAAGRVTAAHQHARRARHQHPTSPLPYVWSAELLRAQNKPKQAVRLLRRAVSKTQGDLGPLWATLAQTYADIPNPIAVRQTIARLRASRAGSTPSIAATYRLLADLEERMGNLGRARGAWRDAHRLVPSRTALYRMASLSERMGDTIRAQLIYAQLCEEAPDDENACTRAETSGKPRRTN